MSQRCGNNSEAVNRLATVFRLLADQTRLHILVLLKSGEMNVSNLCIELRLPQPTVSHHLGLMRSHHLLANRKLGKEVFYALARMVEIDTHGFLHISIDDSEVFIGLN